MTTNSKARVLVVEDNDVNQMVALALLEHLGYNDITLAADGSQALERWKEGAFDVVLMDCQMPVMDGYAATAGLRGLGCNAPIIAMTANAISGDRERCLAAGMDDYLTKPVDVDALQAMLKSWVAEPGAAPAAAAAPEPTVDEVPVFDRADTLARFMNDAQLLGRALAAFLAAAPRTLNQVGACLLAGDANGLAQQAHSLKGSALTVGAAQLGGLARDLETVATRGDLVTANKLQTLLRTAFADFQHEACATA